MTLAAEFTFAHPGGPAIAFSFAPPADRVTALFGPSGCGKTTVLRCLAGLDRPHRGTIALGSDVWFDAASRVNRPPQRRGVGFLSQKYALFPHLTAAANVGYAVPRRERASRTKELLAAFQLGGLGNRYPHQLSGGQQQRVALARAVAGRPRLLLLDEPFSALDGPTRDDLRTPFREFLVAAGVPTVLVTHDRGEVVALADRVVVMTAGRVRQQGDVADVFSRPADAAVAKLVGVETVIAGLVVRSADGLATVAVGAAEVVAVSPLAGHVLVCVRGEDVTLARPGTAAGSPRNVLVAVVTSLEPAGPLVRVTLDAGFPLTAVVTRPAAAELGLGIGTSVAAVIKAPAIHLVARPGG